MLGEDGGSKVDGEVAMEGVEHLGQYVFEMSKTKLEQLQGTVATEPTIIEEDGEGDEGMDNGEDEE
jgi:intron-binding protein aquarius